MNRDLTAMLYGVVASGTGGYASLHGREAAGKTGTTQDSHDAWFVGFTTDYVAAAWVGNDDSSPTRGVTGGTLPAYIWRDTMLAAEQGLPLKPLDTSVQPPPEETQADGLRRGMGRHRRRAAEPAARPAGTAGRAGAARARTAPSRRLAGLAVRQRIDDDEDAPPPPPRFRALSTAAFAQRRSPSQ